VVVRVIGNTVELTGVRKGGIQIPIELSSSDANSEVNLPTWLSFDLFSPEDV
jgi:hypothetical protein